MFSTFKQKVLLLGYIFLLLTIPVGSYLVSQYQTIKSSAAEQKTTKPLAKVTPKPTTSPAKELLGTSLAAVSQGISASPTPDSSEPPAIATSYGPTLAFKVIPEGSPADNQATRMFVGITEGTLSSNPKFLLSFTVNVPANGEYSNISLAGLTPGTQYTALLKGASQIAASVTFIMSPAVSNLNSNDPIKLISGDLNDDNAINDADYSLALKALNATPQSTNWNANADLNKDSVINIFDLAIITKNKGQIGASGTWTSPIPQTATPSASLNTPSAPIGGSSPNGGSGYWIWIPK